MARVRPSSHPLARALDECPRPNLTPKPRARGATVPADTLDIFADFFSTEDSPAAFANIILQYGIASVFAFFAFPDFDATTKELLLLFTAALGFLSYFTAHVLHTREKKAAAYRELESPAGGGDAGFA